MSAPRPMAKGWCPGVLRPMASGDGFIARVRPRGAALPAQALAMLARATRELGNGLADLTSQANIQLRGLSEAGVAALAGRLAPFGLLDADAQSEARRNIVISPLTGCDPQGLMDVRPLAADLARALQDAADLAGLPPKFSVVIDGGGALPLGNVSAAIRFEAFRCGDAIRFLVARGNFRGQCAAQDVAAAALALARGNTACAGLDPLAGDAPRRAATNADDCLAVFACGAADYTGALAPYGRLTSAMLDALAQAVSDSGAQDLRLTPWRAVLAPCAPGKAAALRARLAAAGFIVAAGDQRGRVAACVGAPACASATTDVRADADYFAGTLRGQGAGIGLHVSGCAKGCAHQKPARVTLTGRGGLYDIAENADTKAVPARLGLTRAEAQTRLAAIFSSPETIA